MPRMRSCVVGAVALVAVSCQDHSSPTANSPPISADFRDAMHRGGNPHFFLLPPLVSLPDLAKETFESGLQPSVRITEQPTGQPTFAGCTNNEFIDNIPATEFTRLKAYAAFWRPGNYPTKVTPPCIYRLQVEVLGAVLGFADVQVISRTTLKDLRSGEYIPLPKDLTLPFWFFVGQGAVFFAQTGANACPPDRDCAEAVVSPTTDNTIVTKNLKAGIFIPAGAFTDPVTLVIEEETARPCIDRSKLGLPQIGDKIGCYRYQRFPSDLQLMQDLTVAMCVEIGLLSHDQLDRLQIFRFDPDERGGTATALQNAPAAFLPCEATRFGLVPRVLNDLAALFGPRPLHAATAVSLIHIGVGGVCGAGRCLSSPVFTWGTPGTVSPNSADPQTAAVSTAVGAAPSVKLINPGHPADLRHIPPIAALAPAPIAGVPVTFRVTAGSGSIVAPPAAPGGPTVVVVPTNSDGVATLASWTLGPTAGTNTVVAEVPGADGSPMSFTANAVAPVGSVEFLQQPTTTVTGGTITPALQVRLRDPFGNPVTQILRVTVGNAPTNPSTCQVLQTSEDAINGVATFAHVIADGVCSGAKVAATAGGASDFTFPIVLSQAFDIIANDVHFVSVALTSTTTLTIGGSSVPYTATVTNGTSATLSGIIVQAWIDQVNPTASRAAGGAVIMCGVGDGVLPPGNCVFDWHLIASNATAGGGTLTPGGQALARFEITQGDNALLDTFTVPVTLVNPSIQ